MLVGIDPGHGMNGDPGAIGPSGLQESVCTIEIGWKLVQRLQKMGYDTLFYGDLRQNMYQGDRAYHSFQQGAGVHISIHANSSEDPSGHGWECYWNDGTDASGKSLTLAQALETYCAGLATSDRGIKACSSNTRTQAVTAFQGPAVIIETAFLSNPAEESMLASDGWREQMAQAIANAVNTVFPLQLTSHWLHRAVFTPGSNMVVVDGRADQIPVPVSIQNGFTLIPLRALKSLMAGNLTPQYAPDGSVVSVTFDY